MSDLSSIKETHQQLKDLIYDSVKYRIVNLEFPPGFHLREAELAEKFKVSKTPVREALLRLQSDGLVEIQAYRGAVVSSYSNNDLMEIYQLREILQMACAREAALSISADDLAELGRVVRDSDEALSQGRLEDLPTLFERFDELIFRQTRNHRIRDLIETLHAHLVRIGILTVNIPGRLDKSVQQHAEIYAAIANRDPGEAESRMRHHITNVLADQLADFVPDAQGNPKGK